VGDTPHVARGELALADPVGSKHDAEAAVALEAVGEHLPVAGLEDVQRERDAREEHERQREEREVAGAHGSKLQPSHGDI
jgi:hypothetical protein